ncbi:MAG: hypothetical protein IJX87_06605 [Clostridia bacterium]|nr:hypothetical protein [Clostridia bacterium]
MKKTAFISDLIFTFFLSSLGVLCLFRFLKISFTFSCVLSAVCGLLITCSVGALLQSKRKTIFLKKSDEETMQKLLLHLVLLTNEAKTSFFRNAIENEKNFVISDEPLLLYSEAEYYFLRFTFSPVSADDILPIAYFETTKQKILFCLKIEEDALQLCKRFGVNVYAGDSVYLFFKQRNALPQRFLGDELPEIKKKRHRKLWFSKTNSRRFLTSGALILFTSLLTPFPYYYLIFGAALLLTALFVRIFGYE